MKPSHYSIARHGFIVLHKVNFMPKYGRYFLVKFSLREAFEEVASRIFEHSWLNDEHTVNICFDYFHYLEYIELILPCPEQYIFSGWGSISSLEYQLLLSNHGVRSISFKSACTTVRRLSYLRAG